MRSACFGARSARSWITMRPLVVSMTIAFFLSRLAGSDCARAGAATTSAKRKARMRIMETPGWDRKELRSLRAAQLYGRARYKFYEGKTICGRRVIFSDHARAIT